jgi:hypothetical protein
MAIEAEELERSAEGPLLMSGAPRAGRRWTGALISASAAAATLLIAVAIASRFAAPPAPGPVLADRPQQPETGPAHTPAPATSVAAAPDPEQCVIMAFYQNAGGECSCLSLRTHEWDGGRRLVDVARSELFDAAFQQQCSTEAQQVYVVAVSGKPGTLPTSREQAEALGSTLAAAPETRSSDISSYAYAALPNLSPDATVVAERLSIRPTSRVRETLAAYIARAR